MGFGKRARADDANTGRSTRFALDEEGYTKDEEECTKEVRVMINSART
jgi:hypothetical protein